MKKTLLCLAGLLALIVSGCGGLKPGDEVIGELSRDSRLSDFMSDPEEVLFAAGRPVSEDWACASHPVRTGGTIVIETESDDFDPVMVAVDKEGVLLALCDDWEGSLDSRLVLRDAPRGTRILVFGIDGQRGEYTLAVSEAEDKDYEEFTGGTSLAGGTVTGEVVEDKDDELMDSALSDGLEQYTWLTSYSRGRVYPFTVSEGGLCSVDLVSENTNEFDPILALVSIDDDEFEYVAYNDDYGMDLNARIDEVLEPGSYAAVVLSYNEQSSGEFTLSLRRYEAAALIPTIVPASAPGTLYQGEVVPGAGLAAGFWPSISRMKPYEVLTSAASPCSFFEFSILPAQTGLYDVDAEGEGVDVFLTLVKRDADSVLYVACNDDFGGSTDSRISRMLTPGIYVAMVSAYGDSASGTVSFSFQPSLTPPTPLVANRPVDAEITLDSPQIAFTFDVVAGRIYTVSSTSVDQASSVDTYIEATLADGSQLTDDDGGGNLNSRLRIDPMPEQSGRVLLVVRDLYNSGTGRVRVELTEESRSQSQVFGLYD
jgi:hypothetical protein